MEYNGRPAWAGKCIHCNRRLLVAGDSTLLGTASVEHIVPKTHGGSDDIENLALACAAYNGEKGVRHDLAGETIRSWSPSSSGFGAGGDSGGGRAIAPDRVIRRVGAPRIIARMGLTLELRASYSG